MDEQLVAGLIEGFRPGVAERLGLGPQDCAKVNGWLVCGQMTGWGQVCGARFRLVTTSTTSRLRAVARRRAQG